MTISVLIVALLEMLHVIYYNIVEIDGVNFVCLVLYSVNISSLSLIDC